MLKVQNSVGLTSKTKRNYQISPLKTTAKRLHLLQVCVYKSRGKSQWGRVCLLVVIYFIILCRLYYLSNVRRELLRTMEYQRLVRMLSLFVARNSYLDTTYAMRVNCTCIKQDVAAVSFVRLTSIYSYFIKQSTQFFFLQTVPHQTNSRDREGNGIKLRESYTW
jgi:hypothetical protein